MKHNIIMIILLTFFYTVLIFLEDLTKINLSRVILMFIIGWNYDYLKEKLLK